MNYVSHIFIICLNLFTFILIILDLCPDFFIIIVIIIDIINTYFDLEKIWGEWNDKR